MDPSTSDIGLCNNKKLFESGTSNILFIKDNKIFSPINKIYKGVTYKFVYTAKTVSTEKKKSFEFTIKEEKTKTNNSD